MEERKHLRCTHFLSRHLIWCGFIALSIAFVVILGMHVWFLFELQESSGATRKLAERNFLISVAREVDTSYRDAARQLLNLSLSDALSAHPTQFNLRFRKKWTGIGKAFFVLRFSTLDNPQLLLFSPTLDLLRRPPDALEARAIDLASARWVRMQQRHRKATKSRLVVDERDERNRLILRPILNDSLLPVALAGMIVDEEFFEDHYIPMVIQRHLPRFFSGEALENVIVTVHDEKGDVVYESQSADGLGDEISRSPSFIFTDFRLRIQSRYVTPEQWARHRFIRNLLLTLLIAIVIGVGILVTMRSASRAEKLARMKTDFVSTASHEIRTPLTSIRILGELLSKGTVKDPDKIREYGERIESESHRLTHLTDNILDFVKVESNKRLFEFERVDVAKMIPEVLRTIEPRLQQASVSLHYEGPADDVVTMVDRDSITEAVLNLVDNAAKYSGSAKDVFVRLEQLDGSIRISVRDLGIGLQPEEVDRIFNEFYRVSNGVGHNASGNGLGLPIAKHIVETHGGRITVESQPEQGSTFTIHLPSTNG